MNGWRPTSVVIQPASIATTAADAGHRHRAQEPHACRGIRVRRHHVQPSQSASSSSAEPIPTIVL